MKCYYHYSIIIVVKCMASAAVGDAADAFLHSFQCTSSCLANLKHGEKESRLIFSFGFYCLKLTIFIKTNKYKQNKKTLCINYAAKKRLPLFLFH